MTTWLYCDSAGSGLMEQDYVQSVDEPVPTVSTNGFGARKHDKWWLVRDGLPEMAVATDRPPYRIPLMSEIAELEPNGLTVVSSFSGCGGSCLGFRMAGYRTLYASEFVPAAAETYAANHPGVPLDTRDIRDVTGASIRELAGLGPDDEVDVFEGSPPCASFSTAGKREAHWGEVRRYSDVEQRTDDLFFEYARVLGELRPRAFVAENVAGLVKGVAKGYFKRVHAAMVEQGYRVEARLLDAQWLGVPQVRKRVIFVGIRADLELGPVFPSPLPYRYTIRDAIPELAGSVKVESSTGFDSHGGHEYVENGDAPSPAILQSRIVNVEVGAGGTYGTEKWRGIDEPVGTLGASPSTGNGRSSSGTLRVRVVDSGRDSDLLSDDDAPSIEHYAIGAEWDKLKPGETSDRYFNLVRPHPDQPSPTLTALGTGWPAGGAAALTHPSERRKFTIAELRRLCGFPDDFVLTGSYAQKWERLGRAVPPPMMRAVAAALAEIL